MNCRFPDSHSTRHVLSLANKSNKHAVGWLKTSVILFSRFSLSLSDARSLGCWRYNQSYEWNFIFSMRYMIFSNSIPPSQCIGNRMNGINELCTVIAYTKASYFNIVSFFHVEANQIYLFQMIVWREYSTFQEWKFNKKWNHISKINLHSNVYCNS